MFRSQLGTLVLTTALAVAVAGCNHASGTQNGGGSSAAALTTGQVGLDTPYARVNFVKNGVPGSTMQLNYAYSSAAFHDPSEPPTQVWTIGDRGPNFGCTDTNSTGQLYTGIKDFCTRADGTVDKKGVIFPTPGYVSTLNHIRIEKNADGKLTATLLEQIGLHDAQGNYVTAVAIPGVGLSAPYDAHGQPLPYDPNGIDAEGLARLPDGSFWLSEEYAPSLLHVSANGQVLERVVPAGIAARLTAAGATYPVVDGLPAILAMRKKNRGIEDLSVSPDGKTLYFSLQSPLANPDKDAYTYSRNVRFLVASLKVDGGFDQVSHEYVLLLDTPDTFADDPGSDQHDVKLSDLTVLPGGRPVIDERISHTTKLERIDFSRATDILGSKWDDLATSPSLEQTDLSTAAAQAAAGVTPTHNMVVFDSSRYAQATGIQLPTKIEGVAILNDKYVLLGNDSDFGIDGASTVFTVLPIAADLAQ
ncbi:MAG: esterase-like activity of phytase family protein [Sinobacteraceae bacterium]|nr:esterase-like activity of phytase family protein [Nevskiaceae bacterium]